MPRSSPSSPSSSVLLCDEPTSALDPELAAEVVDVLGQLAKEGMTMLIAAHGRFRRQPARSLARLEHLTPARPAVAHIVPTASAGEGINKDIFKRPAMTANQ